MTDDLIYKTTVAQVTKVLATDAELPNVVRKKAKALRTQWKRERANRDRPSACAVDKQESSCTGGSTGLSCDTVVLPAGPCPYGQLCQQPACPLAHPDTNADHPVQTMP